MLVEMQISSQMTYGFIFQKTMLENVSCEELIAEARNTYDKMKPSSISIY
jgi:hypothetical protein